MNDWYQYASFTLQVKEYARVVALFLSLSLSFDIKFGNGGGAGRGLGCYQDSIFVCVCGVQVLHYKWKNIYFIFHWELLFLFVCYSNIWFCLKPLHSCFHKDFWTRLILNYISAVYIQYTVIPCSHRLLSLPYYIHP